MSRLLTGPNGVTKLTTTFSLAKLQAVERAPHSAGAKSAATTRGASDRTIDRAEPCFITNVSAYTHQQAHWINAIRGDDDKHADAMALVASSKSLSFAHMSFRPAGKSPSLPGYC